MELSPTSCQNVAMTPKTHEKRPETVSIMVSIETKDLLAELAKEDSRSVSWVAHELLLRGVAQFRRDGLVREPDGGAVT